ncbi:glutathione S-transferase family protein [Plastoroseomonas hellenica]|uniref:glutathione S-transferase family protein n=1 Tax=Plastoroseomonas hellenica TaxID=2687306 RepID=UPI001BA907DC|nr:glutathione binding-like protein [Plastoroseomonas hellenica]MBR0647888.1 glutathione S-transferase [Plastoroseomonas hellenica]
MHRLYYSPGACSLAPHIVLEEIGIPYALELRSARNAEGTSTPEYLALNPKGRVPALAGVPGSAGGATGLLTEAPAILFFLARSHPQARLLPGDPAAEARCLEWMNWLSGTVHGQSFGQIWRAQRLTGNPTQHAAIIAKGEENLGGQYAYVEALLADGRDWAVPGQYSIADPFLLVFWLWGQRIGIDMAGRYPAWAKLSARILARPAVQRALEQERVSVAAPPA